MLAIGLSLAACLGWGVADYLGGIKSRQLSVLSVLIISTFFGLGLIIAIVWARGQGLPHNPMMLFAIAAGAAGTLALLLLYRAMAIGSIAIIAPISATGVVLPVLMGLASGDNPSHLQGLGMAAAMIGSVLASREKNNGNKEKRPAAGIGLAVGAAVCVGTFFIVMDHASDVDPYWAALIMRASQCIFLLAAAVYARPPLRIGRIHLPALIALGFVDALANFSWAIAATRGMLSLVSVIGALYPAVTVLLAVMLLKERPRRVQGVGVILAIVGVVLISAG